MVFLKKILLLIILSLLLISCDDVITWHLDSSYIKVDFVKCENNKCIIVKTDKFCEVNLGWNIEIFYENEHGEYENIKIKNCKSMNSDMTKFRINLKDSLEPGILYKTCTDHDDLICYFEFEYTE